LTLALLYADFGGHPVPLWPVGRSWSHAVATRSRWRRGQGFKGKGGVGGARECDGHLLTALCRRDVRELTSWCRRGKTRKEWYVVYTCK